MLPGWGQWPQGCMTDLCGDGVVKNRFLKDGKAVNFQGITEVCDNGADNGKPGVPCSATCQITVSPFCGNGVVNEGEQCDNGAQNSDTVPDVCRTNCSNYRCGDGVIDSGEQCDDSNVANGDGCSSICVTENPAAPVVTAQVIDLPLLPPGVIPGVNVNADVTQIATSHAPAGQTGPGAIMALAAGAAAGYAWVRRRNLKRA